jgi:hypothetical protein
MTPFRVPHPSFNHEALDKAVDDLSDRVVNEMRQSAMCRGGFVIEPPRIEI